MTPRDVKSREKSTTIETIERARKSLDSKTQFENEELEGASFTRVKTILFDESHASMKFRARFLEEKYFFLLFVKIFKVSYYFIFLNIWKY